MCVGPWDRLQVYIYFLFYLGPWNRSSAVSWALG